MRIHITTSKLGAAFKPERGRPGVLRVTEYLVALCVCREEEADKHPTEIWVWDGCDIMVKKDGPPRVVKAGTAAPANPKRIVQ